jgi:ferric-dicitrate binding protein FerR (iron transport regulator)
MSEFFDWLENKAEKGESNSSADANFRDLEKVWHASLADDIPEPPDNQLQWQSVQRKISDAEDLAVQPLGGTAMFLFRLKPMLAMAAVMLLSVAGWYGWKGMQPEVYHTDRGQRMSVTLSDRSEIAMNAVSDLHLDAEFNKTNRNLHLEGEAFFSVTKGQHPFIIHTALGTVRVVGTKFNVYARGDKLEVGVVEGEVEVSTQVEGKDHVIRLTPGQAHVVHAGVKPSNEPMVLEMANYPPWLDNYIYCQSMPLGEVAAEGERRLNIKIQLARPELKSQPISGLISTENAETMLKTMSVLAETTYVKEGDVFIIQ